MLYFKDNNFKEIFKQHYHDFSQGIKNPYFHRLKTRSKKQSLTLFLNDDIVNWYKQNEIKHQTEINHLLKEYIKNH